MTHFHMSVYSQGTMSQEDAVGDLSVPPDPSIFENPSDKHAPVAADKTDQPSSSPSLSLDTSEHELTSEGAEEGAPLGQVREPPQDQSEEHSCDQVTECNETVSLEPEVAEGEVEVGVPILWYMIMMMFLKGCNF